MREETEALKEKVKEKTRKDKKMKNNMGYELDFDNKQIVVAKYFLKAVSIVGSKEYALLTQLRKDYQDFPIVQREIKKKQGKKTYGNLTYKVMKEFIEGKEDKATLPSVLTEFQHIQELSKAYIKLMA